MDIDDDDDDDDGDDDGTTISWKINIALVNNNYFFLLPGPDTAIRLYPHILDVSRCPIKSSCHKTVTDGTNVQLPDQNPEGLFSLHPPSYDTLLADEGYLYCIMCSS